MKKKSFSDDKNRCISDTVVKLILVTAEASSSTSFTGLTTVMMSVDNVPGIRTSTKIFKMALELELCAFDTE